DNFELDLGFDSLDKVELLASLEGMFGVALPETFISQIHTVGDLVAAIKLYQQGGLPGTVGAPESHPKKSDDFSGAPVSWKSILEKAPSAADANKIEYSHNPVELAVVVILLMGLKLACKIFFRLKVEGRCNIPGEGPFVITPNHTSYLDGFIIAATLSLSTFRKLYFLGTTEYFTGGIKSWF